MYFIFYRFSGFYLILWCFFYVEFGKVLENQGESI